MKHFCNFLQLTLRLLRTEINRGADAGASHVEGLLDIRKTNLIEAVRIRKKLVVIELQKERNLVRVLPCNCAENAKRGGDGITATFNCELHNVFGIEIERVWSKRCPSR